MVDKQESKIEQVEISEVPTQYGLAYKLPDGKLVSEPEYMVWLGNLVLKISKSVA